MKDTSTCAILLEKAKNPNDEPVWQEFCDKYEAYIYMLSINYGLDPESAKDLTQIVLIKLWKKLPLFKYNPKIAKFRSWLSRVVKNEVMSTFRSQKRRIDITNGYLETLSEENIDRAVRSEWEEFTIEVVLSRVEQEFTGQAIEVFKLYLKGLDAKEIAHNLNLKADSVYKLKNRVKTRLASEVRCLPLSLK
ncbi:MAG: sigma-70 family RNA polymerase sigma factor [Lentisphaeraceae bacterium]|nr:sigma-70 family RNA polymerase sigma factor [Lentisphaeraceae bacterium]